VIRCAPPLISSDGAIDHSQCPWNTIDPEWKIATSGGRSRNRARADLARRFRPGDLTEDKFRREALIPAR
jgi:hypothetical protein